MRRVVRRASEVAPVMVLQGNTRDAGRRKKSVDFLRGLLEAEGFPEVTVSTLPGFSRPLLVGRRAAG
jgi:hypothetical protein